MLKAKMQYREALGKFATGVCVIGAVNEEGAPIGMTINSFSSVSLEPSLILWSLKKDSISHKLFSSPKEYSVSVLTTDQKELSSRYARAGDHLLQEDDYLMSQRGIPYIRESLAYFQCENWQVLEAGDHDVLLAKVLE